MSASTAALLALLLVPGTGADAPAGDDPAATGEAEELRERVERARAAAARGDQAGAAGIYRASASEHPSVARWLRLSALQAAGRAGDLGAARSLAGRLLGDPVLPADSVRVEIVRAAFGAGRPETGLQAAERVPGAADPSLWASRVVPALLSRGDTARAVQGLASALSAPAPGPEVGELLVSLEPGWRSLARVADSDLREGRDGRGLHLLARALEAAPPPERPGLAVRLAEASLESGDHARVRRVADRWMEREGVTDSVRARLALVRGRSDLRRGRPTAARHLEAAVGAGTGEAAAHAALLLADRARDRGRLSEARERYGAAASAFPDSRHGALALIRLGMLAFRDGRYGEAARRFRAYRAREREGPWGHASLYWEARAREAAGGEDRAATLYRRSVRRDPLSYYAVRAAERSSRDPWSGLLDGPPAGRSSSAAAGGPARRPGPHHEAAAGPRSPDPPGPEGGERRTEALVERMDLLRSVGWRERGLRELEAARWVRRAGPDRRLDLARRLNSAGWTGRGIALAWDVFEQRRGRWSRELLRAVFPFPYRDLVEETARRHGVDPIFFAAVIRQESGFDAWTVSSAGAVGLAQLMPQTARGVALRSGAPAPGPERLTDPELNLRLGARHLARLLERFDGSTTAALIAYNAGATRYRRWRRLPEFGVEEELFIERIPFAETRRYVKAVHRNVSMYRRLYGAPD